MAIAALLALYLGAQPVDVGKDTIEQWENRLLESKWLLEDEATGTPRILLVLQNYPVDHRIFRLCMYNPRNREGRPWLETWTGTYKMEARRSGDKEGDHRDAVKLIRLQADRYWLPVNRERVFDEFEHQFLEKYARLPWTETLDWIDWIEQDEFKPFFAELIFDAPYLPATAVTPADNVRFLLRSDEVSKISWWKIGTVRQFFPVWKR